ncbi:MAG: DNA polymerase sliding clamp [Candidatus Methanoliparum thermophilum]|uniref:DNA polymerase sliding clamp n=1 Tax=Methanoliparum thermophilum TaxID=2491083 RepID=A0A520KSQ6_METT2|nr:DNA polymerase sliding clamp [Candidatus Methanoliparum sp. LAM-1]RZN64958.1 MAG: DNA polymerase sliding clamp [Candidatus Methanoliparum thermophilum]BDC36159.1 DNA polymerase III sliding clamp [Candidatus Methanoliparum sp. LAM-1]
MFKALINGDVIKNALMGVSILSNDVKMNFNDEGIYIKAVDDANVCMVSLNLKKDDFDYFDASSSSIGLNIKTAYDLLKDAKKGEPIEIELLEKDSKIKFSMGNLSYSLVLLNIDAIKKEPKTPKIDLPVEAVINGEDFKKAVKAAEKISDYIIFNADNEGLKISSKGNMRDMFLSIPKEELMKYSIKEGNSVRSMFSLEYVSEIAKVFTNQEDVELHIGNDFPILMKSNIAKHEGFIEYLLAPRVEEGY